MLNNSLKGQRSRWPHQRVPCRKDERGHDEEGATCTPEQGDVPGGRGGNCAAPWRSRFSRKPNKKQHLEKHDKEPRDKEPRDKEPRDEEPREEEPRKEEPRDEEPREEEPREEEPRDEEPREEEPREEEMNAAKRT